MFQPTLFAAESLLHEGQRAMTTERLLNVYAELAPGGRQPVTLRSVPGLIEKVQLGPGPVEAMLSADGLLYAVTGGNLVSWDGNTVSILAPMPLGTATMAWNGLQVVITAGGQYFVWDGEELHRPTDGIFTSVGSVDYMDGFIVRSEQDGVRFDITGILDALDLNAVNFAAADARPDKILRAMASSGVLWLLGETSVEAWQNTGLENFPFTPMSSTVIEKGLRTTAEAAKLDNTIMWISDEPRVYRQTEFVPQRLSTHTVETVLDGHRNATCFTYQYQGHDFFVVRFSDRPAWVYAAATQSWHERGTRDGFWKATATVHHQGTWYAGTTDGYLCTFGGFQDQGEELWREVISRNLENGGNRFRVQNIDLRMEVGSGGQYMYSYSYDGGRTFTYERIRSLGGVGEYDRRVQLRSLGQHREFALKVRCTDPVDFAIYGAGVQIG